MRYFVVVLALILNMTATAASANFVRQYSEEELAAAADIIVFGVVRECHEEPNGMEYALVGVATVIKGEPITSVEVWLATGISEMDIRNCTVGKYYTFYLQKTDGPKYAIVNGPNGAVALGSATFGPPTIPGHEYSPAEKAAASSLIVDGTVTNVIDDGYISGFAYVRIKYVFKGDAGGAIQVDTSSGNIGKLEIGQDYVFYLRVLNHPLYRSVDGPNGAIPVSSTTPFVN